MRVIRHLAHLGPAARPRIVATGTFDGVHRGHQQVLARAAAHARAMGGESVAVVARGNAGALRLTDRRQQIERVGEQGIDVVVFVPASQVETAGARLAAVIRVAAEGSAVAVPAGCRLDIVARAQHGGAPISAAAIHAALARGDLAAARAMLGRDAGVAGRVVHGFHRGAPLGIPTANLRVRGIRLPPDGVYATRAILGGQRLRGVANIGFNPTFGNHIRTVETHVLDFSADLYGQRVEVAFLIRLRDEQKFPDVAALLAQIRDDIAAARRYFDQHGV